VRWSAALALVLACEAPASPAAPVTAPAPLAPAAPAAVAPAAPAPLAPAAPAPLVWMATSKPVSSAATVPADAATMAVWLASFAYRAWAPQTDIRATGEHGGERLYFNDTLAASMRAGASEHPIGSAAVRELYAADLVTLRGFAVMHKTGPSGPVGEGWYWYEVFGTTAEAEPTVAGPAARGCVGCHSHAVDFVHSPDTPRADPQPLL
jgi:hypothetical protein